MLKSRTMMKFFITLFVIVSVVGANVNLTVSVTPAVEVGVSRMEWMKQLFDHHEWTQLLNETSEPLPSQCREDIRTYLKGLNAGQLWASKIYDASGQYVPNALFGNEYWLGSLNACKDLQLKQYYSTIPPFATTFYVARINITVDKDHLPQSKTVLVGQCVPASCSSSAIRSLLGAAEAAAERRATADSVGAEFRTLLVRPVPGGYEILQDPKLHILLAAMIAAGLLMLSASIYEGQLERRYNATVNADMELANDDQKHGDKHSTCESKKSEDDSGLRRDVCGVWSELLLSFSVLTNGRAILCTERPSDGALTCLHGMRFLSVVWVIMVHTYLTIFFVSDNKTMRTVTERNFLYQSVGNASYCVDTFFFISGLLVTILFLRSEDKKAEKKAKNLKQQYSQPDVNKNNNCYTNSALSVSVISQDSFREDLLEQQSKFYTRQEFFGMIRSFFVLFFYRVVRLTPAYAFVIGVNELALRYTHDHTVFEPAIYDHITCDKFWWRNLLYINNLFPQREMCMVWSWYMANDTQFYVVGIILLLISVKYLRFATVSLLLVMVSSWATTIYISVWHQYKARIQEPFEMFDPLYDKPWSRIGPYLIGMMVGQYLHKTKCQVKIPYWLVAAGWPAALAIIGSLIFGMVDGYFEVWPTAFYISVGHTAWGVALAWVAIACCCGYGGLVNSALSYQGLLPLSRLTYCAYLIHPTIMMYSTFLSDGAYHLENSMVISIYAGYAVMAFLASFLISLAFEAPAVRLIKIAGGRGRRRPKT